MSFLSETPRETLQGLFDSVSKDKPAVGCMVRAVRGKHSGKIGIVTKHMLSRFKKPFRYGSPASHMMTEARGRFGYVVKIRTESGEEFWLDADLTMVCLDGGSNAQAA